jgi:hypothetical protein
MLTTTLHEKTYPFAAISTATYSTAIDVSRAKSISIQVDSVVSTPSGANVSIQRSNDGVTWAIKGSAVNITANGTVWVEDTTPNYKFMRIAYAISSGAITTSACHVLVKS